MTRTQNTNARETDWPTLQRDNKPWTRWWWPGSAVDEKNLTRELKALRAAGFGGVEITPIYGVKGAEARDVKFLSDCWLELMAHTCREAKRFGLGVDIIPGTGWRTGGAGVPLHERAVKLELKKTRTSAGVRYTAVAVPSGEMVKRPAPGGAGYSLDMLDGQAVKHWMERFNRRFFSKVPADLVRAQFHDSWEYETDWSRGLMDEFRKRRGYDLQDYLAVFDQDSGAVPKATAARVLCDYRVTVEEMLLDNFSRNWNSLCKKRGQLTRNQAHGSPGNLLDIYAVADIPETEMFRDSVDPLIQKFASSAGHVAGRPLISSESFTWLSEHWCSDLGKIKRYTDYLFLCGINHIFYHGTAYSPADAVWPGWLFYASTQVNDRNPLWRDWPAVNAYIARCQSFLQAGTPDESVLVYWPINDLHMRPDGRLQHFVVNGDYWCYGEELRQTAQSLLNKGVMFDYISDRQLQQATGAAGQVRTAGGTYRAVVVPPLRHIPLETAQALRDLAQAGVPVISAGSPGGWDVPGFGTLKLRRQGLKKAAADLIREPAFVSAPDPAKALDAVAVGVESFQVGTGLRCVRRRLDNGDTLYFIANRGDTPFSGWIKLAVSGASATLRDPWTGRSGIAAITSRGLRLQLAAWQSILVVVSTRRPEGVPWAYTAPSAGNGHVIHGPWTISFVAGGPRRPKPVKRSDLVSITKFGDPELQRFGGTVRYETRFDAPPGPSDRLWLDLGAVRHSARVFLNECELGVQVMPPYRFELPAEVLKRKANRLAIEVTTLAVNRIRDLDRQKVPWRIFHDINFVNLAYKPFDASGWELAEAGLLGPVSIAPREEKP